MFRTAIMRNALRAAAAAELEAITKANTFKKERVIVSPQSTSVRVQGGTANVINFCANNYLGLSNDPDVCAAAKRGIDSHGFGMSSVRFICGTQDLHKQLEQDVSNFLGTEDTILYPSCFDANAGVFEAILKEEDVVISDTLNHASIIDGIRLCKAQRERFRHLDMAHLEELLTANMDKRIRLIVTDGVFSMDGDVAPLDKIVALSQKYKAQIFVDESHSSGFMGPKGRGTPALFGVEKHIDIINSTLGKALGGASGGFSSGSKEIVTLQRQRGRPYLFSNSVPPAVAAGSIAALRKVMTSDCVGQLQGNTTLFRKRMKAAGFTVLGHDSCPIAPILLKDAGVATKFADKMLEKGIYVIGFSYPVVPQGLARIRVQISAAHTTDQLEQAITAFIATKAELGV